MVLRIQPLQGLVGALATIAIPDNSTILYLWSRRGVLHHNADVQQGLIDCTIDTNACNVRSSGLRNCCRSGTNGYRLHRRGLACRGNISGEQDHSDSIDTAQGCSTAARKHHSFMI